MLDSANDVFDVPLKWTPWFQYCKLLINHSHHNKLSYMIEILDGRKQDNLCISKKIMAWKIDITRVDPWMQHHQLPTNPPHHNQLTFRHYMCVDACMRRKQALVFYSLLASIEVWIEKQRWMGSPNKFEPFEDCLYWNWDR